MPFSSPELQRLLSSAPVLPLVQTGLQPQEHACRMRLQNAADLFPGARHAQAAQAGLLLRLGCWAESHQLAQDIHSAEGSYWHAITHRMEPDSANAGYWFRQVGSHRIFPDLLRGAKEILDDGGPKNWRLKNTWDPFLFLRWCEEALETGGHAEAAAKQIQMAEWELLFDWCSSNA